ncbi:MAG TPA: DNA alkylation repair protein [Phycicoccus sp.]|nr:DNA alkylation repair protein [Phycicoccus sp.]
MGDLAGAVRAALEGAGDPERARAQQAYMRSAMPFRGVPSPELRRLLRPVLGDPGTAPADRAEWEAAVRGLWDGAAYREERYAAIAVARMRVARPWQDVVTLDLYRHLVATGAWWDLVDPVAVDLVGPILLRDRDAATPVVRSWAVADDLWLRRTALIAQLKHREDTDVGLLAEVVDANLEGSPFGNEFFVRKAIGWALRQYARTDPAWVAGLVASRGERLSGLSRREALKHL